MPVDDEGKICTDSSQCEDICRMDTYEDDAGICTGFSGGCDIVIDNGKKGTICS